VSAEAALAEGQAGSRRGRAAEDLILRTVAAHAESLLRTARRHSLCADDAQDAYQRALEIFMTHAERLDASGAAGWLHVVVKREAQTIRRSRARCVPSHDVDFDAHEARSVPTPDERLAAVDLVGRAAEALQRLKPQELRALWLRAQGHSYNEISALTGWSYTKVNRCLTEGRRSFLSRYATIESGAECERWLTVLSAIVDGEATSEQLVELRPHLRNCPGCRATLRALQDSSQPLSAVLPVPLAAVLAGEDQLANIVTRLYETLVGGFHERAVYSLTKAQSAVEAASAGKLAAVAASAAAVAGGGYATVERQIPRGASDQPEQVVRQAPSRQTAAPAGAVATASSPPARGASSAGARRTRVGEFASRAARRAGSSPEFRTADTSAGVQFARAAVSGPPSAGAAPPASPPAKAAPEFGSADAAPEFGG
jgi:RNA polymerase sigma factor (sigma-70 family)